MKPLIIQFEKRTLEKIINGTTQFFINGNPVDEIAYQSELNKLDQKQSKGKVYFQTHKRTEGHELGVHVGDRNGLYDSKHITHTYTMLKRKRLTFHDMNKFIRTHHLPIGLEYKPAKYVNYISTPTPEPFLGHYE